MNLEKVINIVSEIINKEYDKDTINIDENLINKGLNLNKTEKILSQIETKLSIKFNKTEIFDETNFSVRELSEEIMKLMQNEKCDNNNFSWWNNIPISINSAFGDALTSPQVSDTCMKLNALSNHKAAYGFCTKAVPTQQTYDELSSVKKTSNMVIRYSLTGLNEGGYSFEQRLEAIKNLKDIFGRVIIVTRPIIWGRNTDKKTLESLVKTAKDTSGLLITGGLHDETKHKKVDVDVKELLINLCKEYDVKYFHKSSCAAAYVTGKDCWVHNLREPKNIFVLDKLGYEYKIQEGKIILLNGTVGDLNFLRMVTGSYIYCENLISGYNLLSFSDKTCKFDVTSSWYSWSQNRPCQINCDYCIIREIEYLDTKCMIGVNPCEIEKYAKNSNKFYKNVIWKKGKYQSTSENKIIGYDDVRTVQACMTDKY